jgi:uncharacterized protein (TIGR03790 family)
MIRRLPKTFRILSIVLALFTLMPSLPAQPDAPGPESVVVVANEAVPGSVRVARAYMQRRNIPERQLILLRSLETEKLTRAEYLSTLHNPLLEALLERDLVNGLANEPDALGRVSATVISTPIRYLVLCYGVPSHITEQPIAEVDDLALRERLFKGRHEALIAQFSEGPMAKNEASVDGELALLLQRDTPLNGFVFNPYYNNREPGGVRDILKVTRLDGPSPRAVIRMLDNALQGETEGLKGRAYVDEDGREGGFKMGNEWLANTASVFSALGFDLAHDTERRVIPADARFDAPVLYAGWYAQNATGPFTLPGFDFPPGAVAAHLHSFSAAPLRSETRGWVGPLVHRGVSATFGNVAEPYMRFTHQFDLFFAALAEGWNLADAAYFALPALSWQAVAIGDPLFRPFAVPLETQLEQTGNPLNILSDQYVYLRRMRLLEATGDGDGAIRMGNRGMRESPGPALAMARARLFESAGRTDDAVKALAFLADMDVADPMQWGLYADLADTLHRLGDARSALRIYRNLESQNMPEKTLLAFLKRGIPVAEDARQPDIAIEWRTRTAPPPPPPPPPAGNAEAVPAETN